jgi:putative ABC transport system permease protein
VRLVRLLRQGLRSVLVHRTRSVLAATGVAVGIAAVVVTSAAGEGARAEVTRAMGEMGPRMLVVRPAQARRSASRREVQGLAASLRLEDREAIEELALVEEAAPAVEGPRRVRSPAGALVTKVMGTEPAFPRVRGFRLASGRFLDDEDDRQRRRVAVLGARVARLLFPGEDPVGREVRIGRVPFQVIGTLAERGASAGGMDEDTQVLVPVRTALRRVFNVRALTNVFVTVADERDTARARDEISALLRERHRLDRHGRPDDFAVQDQAKLLATTRQAARTLTLATTGLAAISLLIGGTGILALMLLSVRERTSEIGLRLAVGARARDVLVQFLGEATVLAAAGGAAGVVLGAAGAAAVAAATSWPARVSWSAALVALALSVAVGLGAGLLPALGAARLPPQAALARE